MFAVVSVVCNEIFPTPIRNVAYAMTQIAESSAAALGPLVFILNGVGQWLPLMLMTIIVFADLIVFHFLVPETKDLPLADAMPDGECRIGIFKKDNSMRQFPTTSCSNDASAHDSTTVTFSQTTAQA
ncbi:unnamed protein product, partial [Mesorhabditis spiculigera]